MEPVWPSSFKAYGFSVQPAKEVTGACFPFLLLLHLSLSLPVLVTNLMLKMKKKKTIKLKVLGDILLTSFVIVRHALHALTAWLL